MTPDPALTRPATRRPGGRPGQHPRRHGPVMPVPRQVRPLCRTACRGRSRYACAGSASNTLPDRRPRRPGSCYLFCMISPIRGDFTGFRVQVPPSDTIPCIWPEDICFKAHVSTQNRRSQARGLESLSDTNPFAHATPLLAGLPEGAADYIVRGRGDAPVRSISDLMTCI